MEIRNLEIKIENLIAQIVQFPESCSKSGMNSNDYKAIVDKNNFLVYSVNYEKGFIEVADFRSTRQKPKY